MVSNNQTVTLTWIKSINLTDYNPITQVYGIIFNEKGEILVCREKPEDKWQIPGGHPEKGETSDQTLVRELKEEVDVTIKEVVPLGVQKVEFPDNPNKKEGDLFYQVRYIAILDKLLPQTPDPANGNTWERKFVPVSKITEYIKWGNVGEEMLKDAITLFSGFKQS